MPEALVAAIRSVAPSRHHGSVGDVAELEGPAKRRASPLAALAVRAHSHMGDLRRKRRSRTCHTSVPPDGRGNEQVLCSHGLFALRQQPHPGDAVLIDGDPTAGGQRCGHLAAGSACQAAYRAHHRCRAVVAAPHLIQRPPRGRQLMVSNADGLVELMCPGQRPGAELAEHGHPRVQRQRPVLQLQTSCCQTWVLAPPLCPRRAADLRGLERARYCEFLVTIGRRASCSAPASQALRIERLP